MSELRRIRVDKRMSIPELAEASGVSPEQIREIEAGRTLNPRPKTLGKLADVLDVQPSELDPILTERSAA